MKISQVEARRLRRRVEALEAIEQDRRFRFTRNYPGGVNIASYTYSNENDHLPTVVKTSRALGHAVVVIDDGAQLRYFAIPHGKMPV